MIQDNKLKIGVFGGTFDPIHIGHIDLIKNIKEEFNLDKVYVIPAGNPYQKSKVTDFGTKFEMTKIATKSMPYVEVLDIEKDDINSYTYNTMSKLKQVEDNNYFLICGSDCIFNIESFYNYEKLLKEFSFIVIPRNEERQNINNKINSLVYKNIFISNYIGENISSSMIRNDFNKYQNYLDKNVLDFIKNKNIY